MQDYTDAAERHYLSANALFAAYPATASHCYGIAAECVLKALMGNLQPQAKRVSGNHIGPRLWDEFANHQTLQTHPSRIAGAIKNQGGFNGWDVGQRYFNQTSAEFSGPRLAAQQQSARGLLGLLQLAQRGLA
ncbi:MAG: hypothetical protein K2X65_02615 [Burkholderiaceae bacterium]|nr:hypothetical protein [Burkholderiaceae bacterium]